MTLDDLLGIGRHLRGSDREEMRELGDGIVDLLGESQPCGFDQPELAPSIGKPTLLWVPATWAAWVSADDARAMARMLLRAADEAEGKS